MPRMFIYILIGAVVGFGVYQAQTNLRARKAADQPKIILAATGVASGQPVKYQVPAGSSVLYLRQPTVAHLNENGAWEEVVTSDPRASGERIDNLDLYYEILTAPAGGAWAGEWNGRAYRRNASGAWEEFRPTGQFKVQIRAARLAELHTTGYGGLLPPILNLASPTFTIN